MTAPHDEHGRSPFARPQDGESFARPETPAPGAGEVPQGDAEVPAAATPDDGDPGVHGDGEGQADRTTPTPSGAGERSTAVTEPVPAPVPAPVTPGAGGFAPPTDPFPSTRDPWTTPGASDRSPDDPREPRPNPWGPDPSDAVSQAPYRTSTDPYAAPPTAYSQHPGPTYGPPHGYAPPAHPYPPQPVGAEPGRQQPTQPQQTQPQPTQPLSYGQPDLPSFHHDPFARSHDVVGSHLDPFGPPPFGQTPRVAGPLAPGWDAPPAGPYPGQVGQPRRRRTTAALAALAVFALLVAGVLGGLVGASLHARSSGGSVDPVELPPVASQGEDRPDGSVARVAAAVLPSVVSLEVRGGENANTGSGFVIDSDGFVLTNNHVVAAGADGGSIAVVFPDGSRADAKIVGRDDSYDLAVVKVERAGLKPLQFADSDQVAVGDEVVAVGSPLGLNSTVTSGIISALNRPVVTGEDQATSFINAVQTDAAINPGNSGGPLVDLAGRVVGVNSAIARAPGLASSGNIGLGFAIPSSQAHRTAQQLIDDGKATHPVIGVLLSGAESRDGAHVSAETQNGQDPVTKDGPADRAGIEPGDVIVKFEGRPISSSDELIVAIRAQVPGDTVTLTVRRDGKQRDVEVTLGADE